VDIPLLAGVRPDGSADADVATRAARAWLAGGIVGLPTETVYGLAADAQDADAVARVYGAKGRPADHPLIVHVQGVQALAGWSAQPNPAAERLAAAFWPGALTVIVARSERAGDFITGGQGTVALRCPDHPVARAALEALARLSGDPARGVAAPSANRFGRVSPTRAQDVLAEVGPVLDPARDLVVDGGPCAIGVESTIVDCTATPPRVLRLGAISQDQVDAVLEGAAGGAGGQGAGHGSAATPAGSGVLTSGGAVGRPGVAQLDVTPAPAGSPDSADAIAAAGDDASEPASDGGGNGADPAGEGAGGGVGEGVGADQRRFGARGGAGAGAGPVGVGGGLASDVRAPGTLESHYAPEAEVLLVEFGDASATELASIAARRRAGHPADPHASDSRTSPPLQPAEGSLGPLERDPCGLATLEGPQPARIMGGGPHAAPSIGLVAESGVDTPDGWTRLAAPVTAEEYARELYAALRAADARDLEVVVAVLPDPDGGPLALAVRDRLARAAHGS
jgi:L-threonylcarbamoyladenylate synthase